MRILQLLALADLASSATLGTALADERINLTPPLFREQARSTAAIRPASELTTTLRLVPAAPAKPRIIAETVPSAR
jgi:hypothetical protein